MAGEILHWNINGLKNKRSPKYCNKTDTINGILENCSSTRILNIQETHFSEDSDLLSLSRNYDHIYNYINTNAPREDSFSGIIIFIHNSDEILAHAILEPGRLVYVKIQNKASKEIVNIFSIYCNSSNSEKQKKLILKLEQKIMLDNLDNIIILGDFNFVTSSLDRNCSKLNSIDLNTSKVWEAFEQKCAIVDSFRSLNHNRRRYSFTSRANKNIKSRIDRIYLSPNICSKAISSSYTVNDASDHRIHKVKIAIDIERGSGIWIFNNTLLGDPVFITDIHRIILEFENMRQTLNDDKLYWDMLKQKIISYSKKFSKRKASNSNLDLYKKEKELESLETLPSQLISTCILERIDLLQSYISSAHIKKIRGSLLRNKIPTFEDCEPKISFLNSLEKRRGEQNMIYNLFDENSQTLKCGTEEVKQVAFDFYSSLYKNEPVDETMQNMFTDKINKKLRNVDKDYLDQNLSEQELYNALLKLQNNKTPGIDGLTKEFYVHFWDSLKFSYMNCVANIIEEKELTEMQKKAAINLIFKKGDRNMIKNYRPISLLNIDLKIITKALAIRISSIIANLIDENQTAVPGRHIENNIHIVQDMIDYINDNDESAALIFLDQEKAFDRMSHSFTIKTLKSFGFGNSFIQWIKILYKDAKSCVKINGFETNEFNIERGMRQGCPLSFFLYVLTAETLSSYIRQDRNIIGLRYKMRNLAPLEHKLVQFADDMEVCVSSNRSIDFLFETLAKFERASNAKINKDKTEGLWVGKWRNRVDKPHNLKWTNDHVKFLGIYVGNKVGASGTKKLSDLNFDEQIEKIKNKLSYWRRKGISLKGRIKVINIFILSRFWYRTRILNLTARHKTLLSTLIGNFIWQNKVGGRVRQEVLCLGYSDGGLQLANVDSKIATQRANRIIYLLSLNEDHIERFLADKLIGQNLQYGQSGLSFGLISNIERINQIKHGYYKYALQQTHLLDIEIKPGCIKSVYTEPLFYNKMFLDENGSVFNLRNYRNKLPKTVKDLKTRIYFGDNVFGNIVQSIRSSLGHIAFLNKNNNEFFIKINNTSLNTKKVSSKDMYLCFLHKKTVERRWENKWENYLQRNDLCWTDIWDDIFDKVHTPYVQSTMWEILHLNFWTGFKAQEVCKLCGIQESSNFHISNECSMLLEILQDFNMNNSFNDNEKISFGINKNPWKNAILFQIKSTIFKSRFVFFPSVHACKTFLINKCKINIIADLRSKFENAKRTHNLGIFTNNYSFVNSIQGGLLSWHINTSNEIVFLG